MKLPEPSPQFTDEQGDASVSKIYPISMRQEIQNLLQKADYDYVYWDTFKHWQTPVDVPAEKAWLALKMKRIWSRRPSPIVDKAGMVFSYAPEIFHQQLHEIDREAPRRLELRYPLSQQTRHRDRYILSSLMEEAIASSQLEGAATTREKAKEMLRTGRPPKDVHERMILNNFHVMQRIREWVDDGESLSLERLLEIQSLAVQDTLDDPTAAGRLRRPDELIHVYDGRDNSVLFTPPVASELPVRLEQLLAYANQDKPKEFIHPVLKGILLHFWMGYLHPFVDGNGRTARALFYWYMIRKGYWLFEFISISRVLRLAPAQYMRAYLYAEHDDNDLNYFIAFNLRAIKLSLRGLEFYLLKKQQESQRIPRLLEDFPGITTRQASLLVEVMENRGKQLTIEEHKKNQKVTYQTARTDLLGLASKGLLRQSKAGKRFVFTIGDALLQRKRVNHRQKRGRPA